MPLFVAHRLVAQLTKFVLRDSLVPRDRTELAVVFPARLARDVAARDLVAVSADRDGSVAGGEVSVAVVAGAAGKFAEDGVGGAGGDGELTRRVGRRGEDCARGGRGGDGGGQRDGGGGVGVLAWNKGRG